MKLVLDLDDNTVKNMQGYSNQHGISINELIENLFNTYIQGPANTIDDEYAQKGSLDDFNKFRRLLTEYLNEAILDIEELAESEESNETDKIMVEVFKVLNRDIVSNAYVLTNLFEEYKRVKNN